MKRILTSVALAASLFGSVVATSAHAENVREEKAQHPRIAKAIHEMEDAVAYMEAAPHDFGGHKAEALSATKAAIEQLRLALQYRAQVDTRHGK